MKRFLLLWMALGLAHFLARQAVAIGVFRHIDVTDLAFAQWVLVPGFQALVLAVALRERGGAVLAAPARLGPRPLFLSILAAAVAVVALGLLFPADPRLSLGSSRGLYAAATAAASVAASAALALRAVRHRNGRAHALLAAGLLGWAAEAFTGFLVRLPDLLLPRANPLLRYVLVLGGLLAAALAALVAAAGAARARGSASAVLFDAAAAFTVAASLIVVLSYYDRPWIVQPWRSVEKIASFLAVLSVLLGALAADTKAGE